MPQQTLKLHELIYKTYKVHLLCRFHVAFMTENKKNIIGTP